MYSAPDQEDASIKGPKKVTIGEAVKTGMVCNETVGYFLVRTDMFLKQCGINPEGIRFRQHRSNEMAHYANDCWDAEVETSYGWIEIAGHADRSAFDLKRHSEVTKVELMAARRLKNPVTKTETIATLDKKANGSQFKGDAKLINAFFEAATPDELKKLAGQMSKSKSITISQDGKDLKLTEKNVKFEEKTTTSHEEKYIPHVIEPSFGIGRILYCVFEHCFKMRENDEARTYFDFPPAVSPLKCSILPLLNNAQMNKKVQEISKSLTLKQIV